MKRAAALLVLALGASHAAGAQSVVPLRATVTPDTVTVGERFRVAVSLPQAESWLELLPPADSDRVRMVSRTRGSASDSTSATATLVAWRTGPADSVDALARVGAADGSQRTVPLRLPLPAVRSVLPADPRRQVPRGPKDVWGAGYDWRMIAGLALLAAVILGLLVRWIVRRRRRGGVAGTPREQALALLERAERSGLLEAGDAKGFYTLVATALRGYAAAVDGRWSEDLTTSEFLARMRESGIRDVDALASVLRSADLAKFARHRRTPDEARRDLAEARRWVETFPPADAEDRQPEEAAA